MHQNDFDEFSLVMGKLGVAFAKKINDELVSTYWGALKDQSLSTVRHLADTHLRFSKFFPKPFELRPKEDRPKEKDAKELAAFQAICARSKEGWDWLREGDSELAEIEWGIARCARIMVTSHESSSVYAEAYREDFKLRERRRALMDQRRAA